jgi:SpoVK/Ycf46/Vps4 family AAA+-type ATPase
MSALQNDSMAPGLDHLTASHPTTPSHFDPRCLVLSYLILYCLLFSCQIVGKDNTGVTDRVVNQLLTLIDGADASMGGVIEDSDDEGEGGKDGGSSNQVSAGRRHLTS